MDPSEHSYGHKIIQEVMGQVIQRTGNALLKESVSQPSLPKGTRRNNTQQYLVSSFMSVKRMINETDGIFFITITCYNWIPLLEIGNAYNAVYKWFNYLKDKGHYITGYVIMPNHFHFLIAFSKTDKNINKIIGNGKRFLAYEIIKLLKDTNNISILKQLAEALEATDRKKGKLHEVFEDSFDIKECLTSKFMTQKLNYIHNNPCSGKWMLANCSENYLHSSAKFYSTGKQLLFPVTHIQELVDIDLNESLL
ncbi:MAG: transposase [Chitinophagaceae bacterium]